MTPALTSSSLYLPISLSSFSLGRIPASLFLLAFTITMTRIVVLPVVIVSDGSPRSAF